MENLKEAGTINKNGIVGKRFDTDAPISIDSMIEILKGYENENTKLFECRCSAFTESGNPVDRIYKSVDSLRELHNFPNPSVSAIALFVNPKGARKKGLYVEQIKAWKDACMNANGGVAKEAARLTKELKAAERTNKQLQKELDRKEKALAETAALLVLRKKADAIWGNPEDE